MISMREGGLKLSLSSLLSISGVNTIPSGIELWNFRVLLSGKLDVPRFLADLDLLLPHVSSLSKRSGTEGNPSGVVDSFRGRVGALCGCRMFPLRRFDPTLPGERVFSNSPRSEAGFNLGLVTTGLLP